MPTALFYSKFPALQAGCSLKQPTGLFLHAHPSRLHARPYDPEVDHEWHEFEEFENTDDPAPDGREIGKFLEGVVNRRWWSERHKRKNKSEEKLKMQKV